jgi:protein TonB
MRLLESTKQPGKRSVGGALFSVILHSAIILLAVFATARAGIRDEKEEAHKVSFVKVKPSEPPPVKKDEPPPVKETPKPKKAPSPPKMAPVTPPPPTLAPPKGFEVLKAPVTVPVNIPQIDLSKAVTNEADFSGKGIAGGNAKGTEGGTGDKDAKGTQAGDDNRTYFEFQVEQPVQALGGTTPQYPESLRSSGEQGTVQAEFVVNENGRAEMSTFKVLNSSNPAFTSAVKRALSSMRFRPAKIGGRSVSQLVQQSFEFKLDKQ